MTERVAGQDVGFYDMADMEGAEQYGLMSQDFTFATNGDARTPLISEGHDQGIERFSEPKWNDLVFAILYVASLIGLVVMIAVGWPNSILARAPPQALTVNSDGASSLIVVFLLIAAVGAVFAGFWLWFMKTFAQQMIVFCVVVNIVLCFTAAAVLASEGLLGNAIFALIGAGVVIIFYYLYRWRIPFAATLLKTATDILGQYPAMILISGGGLLVLILFAAVYALGVAVVAGYQDDTSLSFGVLFLVFSFLWTTQVIRNVAHTTCSGVYATHYFLFNTGRMPSNPTTLSLKRSMTYSFGSICLGSLVIAIIETLRFVMRALSKGKNRHPLLTFIAACADCMLACVDAVMQYVNVYAFTQVAIYGKSYCRAAKDTWNLLLSHGVDIIVNDDLIGPALTLTAFMVGVLTAAVGAGVAWLWTHNTQVMSTMAVISFLVGMMEAVVALEVVRSGVACIFVCFAEAPHVLQANMPQLFETFRALYGTRLGFFGAGASEAV